MIKKLTLFGHICRMSDNRLLKSVLFGSMEGVRCRWRQPKQWLDNITEWTGLSIWDDVKMTQDRDVWKSFVFGLNGPWPWDMMTMMMMMMITFGEVMGKNQVACLNVSLFCLPVDATVVTRRRRRHIHEYSYTDVKGDISRHWRAFYDPLRFRNPWTDFVKIWHLDYVTHPAACTNYGGRRKG